MLMAPLRRFAWPCVALAVALGSIGVQSEEARKPMSFHNRLLLNRLAVNGHKTLEVLLLTSADGFDDVLARVEQLNGRATRTERAIGYIRATVALEKLLELVDASSVEAYQVASLSKGGWYLDAAPEANVGNFRRWEGSPVVSPPAAQTTDLPMSVETAHRINRAADADVGIDEWLSRHPSYDGRGVTIALLESAQVEFGHPAFQSAKTLDGVDVPKFTGILNSIDLDEPDATRVDLATEIVAVSTWHLIGTRTYILPRPGTFRFGLFTLPAGVNLVYQFGVLRDIRSGETWVDTDGDTDFREETPIVLSAEAVHTQQLYLSAPREVAITFAVTEGRSPEHINVYAAIDNHHTMTASVAAGNRNGDSLAYGVAPSARILLARNIPGNGSIRALLETYLDTMRRDDVDIVCTSTAFQMLQTSEKEFVALFFRRLMDTYNKPIINSGGNGHPRSTSTWSVGDEFAVGGATSPVTFAEVYGVGEVRAMVVDPRAAGGPALSGALKPDFVAPVYRIAASLLRGSPFDSGPTKPPLPIGYQVSCCTSATSPYAAGVVALLVSGAKQANVPYSVASLRRALYASARVIPGWSSYQQGVGLLNIDAAWAELQREEGFPSITVGGPNVHLFSSYSGVGARGAGLFEREGWHAGMRGQRSLTVTRTSGPVEPTHYRLSWTGNDGTFTTEDSISLALARPITLPVRVHPQWSGAHSAILNLHDPRTGAIVLRTHVMVVAAEPIADADGRIRLSSTLSLFESKEHFIQVPRGVQAMRLDLQVQRGRVTVAVVRSDTMIRNYYFHLDPSASRIFPPGRYSLTLPLPTAGVWSLTVSNSSAVRDRDNSSTEPAEYGLDVQLLTSTLTPHLTPAKIVTVDIANLGAALGEPAIDASTGTLRIHEEQLPSDGLPSQIPIDVPLDTTTLMLKLRGAEPQTNSLDLHLYDCTTGECFSYDFTLPAGPTQTLVVRTPKAGRWMATVNSAPTPGLRSHFVLEEILTGTVARHTSTHVAARAPGARWKERVQVPTPSTLAQSGAAPILLLELIDAAAERDALTHTWEYRQNLGLPNLGERRVAVGTAIMRIPN